LKQQSKKKKFFSHEYIVRRLGIKSRSVFSNILARRQRVSEETIERIIEVFDIQDPDEAEYFRNLIFYHNAKNDRERRYCLEKILLLRCTNIKKISVNQYEMYNEWYIPVIWNIIGTKAFGTNYKAIGKKLRPPVSSREVRYAINVLLKIGCIAPDYDGGYRQTKPVMSTGTDIDRHEALTSYNIKMIRLAIQAIRRKKDTRNCTGVTACLSKEEYDQAIEMVTECRRKIMQLAYRSSAPDRVVQFNFQDFHLTQPPKE